MNTKHTPAPWTFQGAFNSDKIFIGKANSSIPLQGGKDTIATVILHGDESAFNQGEQTANARLIATAPELLESLLSVVALVEFHIAERSVNADEEKNFLSCAHLIKARAAIAKAKGEA